VPIIRLEQKELQRKEGAVQAPNRRQNKLPYKDDQKMIKQNLSSKVKKKKNLG
jgi:hypothetical protein